MDHAVMQSVRTTLVPGRPGYVSAASQLSNAGFAVSLGVSRDAETLPDGRVEQLRIESSQSSV